MAVNEQAVDVCFVNPAMMPDWFWLPVAHGVAARGHDYFVPDLQRKERSANAEQSVDAIEAAMSHSDSQFIVALSRGVEFAVRYISRMEQQDQLHKLAGWMVISSVGPKGLEVESPATGEPMHRHTARYAGAIGINERGLEVIETDVAWTTLLHGFKDEDYELRLQTLSDLKPDCPLSPAEIAQVPHLSRRILPLTWYIGAADRVDNRELSAAVATERYDATPKYTDWGHVGPLSHINEVVEAIDVDARKALFAREAHA
jgi:hypothetical protein